MANDDFYTVTTNWTAVEANGADITNGTFSVFSQSTKRVGFIKASSAPTDQNGVVFFDKPKESFKYTLGASEELYAKTNTGTAIIGVVPS